MTCSIAHSPDFKMSLDNPVHVSLLRAELTAARWTCEPNSRPPDSELRDTGTRSWELIPVNVRGSGEKVHGSVFGVLRAVLLFLHQFAVGLYDLPKLEHLDLLTQKVPPGLRPGEKEERKVQKRPRPGCC